MPDTKPSAKTEPKLAPVPTSPKVEANPLEEKSKADAPKPAPLGTAGDHSAHQTPQAGAIADLDKPLVSSDDIIENTGTSSFLDFSQPEPKAPAGPEKVAFQYDRDTTIVAQVIERWDDGTVDLIANTDPTGYFKTNIFDGASDKVYPNGASDKVYPNVRPGSRFEPGTYFELIGDAQELSVGSKIDIQPGLKKQPLKRQPEGGLR